MYVTCAFAHVDTVYEFFCLAVCLFVFSLCFLYVSASVVHAFMAAIGEINK